MENNEEEKLERKREEVVVGIVSIIGSKFMRYRCICLVLAHITATVEINVHKWMHLCV